MTRASGSRRQILPGRCICRRFDVGDRRGQLRRIIVALIVVIDARGHDQTGGEFVAIFRDQEALDRLETTSFFLVVGFARRCP